MNVPTIGQNFDIAGYNTVQCSGNPEADAQNFAAANGISVDEAKAILQGQFGAPGAAHVQNNSATSGVTNVTADPEPELAADATLDLDEIEAQHNVNTTNNTQTLAPYSVDDDGPLFAELSALYGGTLTGVWQTDFAYYAEAVKSDIEKGGITEKVVNAQVLLRGIEQTWAGHEDEGYFNSPRALGNFYKDKFVELFGTTDKNEILTRFYQLADMSNDWANKSKEVLDFLGIGQTDNPYDDQVEAQTRLHYMHTDIQIMMKFAD